MQIAADKTKKKSIRLQIIEKLGGKCMWPGGCDVTDPDMLQIDHVKNNGKEHREKYGAAPNRPYFGSSRSLLPGHNQYYKDMLVEVTSGSKDYQLLCANHNTKKHAVERCCNRKENKEKVPCPCGA